MNEEDPLPVGSIVMVDPKTGEMYALVRWSWPWLKAKLHFALISVLDWFRALPFYWYGFKTGVTHRRESPGCAGSRIELRIDNVRGEHWYCLGCLRPIKGYVRT